MQLFIMRHGEAESRADTDAQRQLTASGRDDIKQMVTTYGHDLSSVEVVWASPYVRAQQTAELVASYLACPVITQAFLPPNGSPDYVISALSQCEQTVLMVSHQPLVGVLVDKLAGLEPGRYRMGTGSLAYLTTDVYASGCCDLQWLHQPLSTQPVV